MQSLKHMYLCRAKTLLCLGVSLAGSILLVLGCGGDVRYPILASSIPPVSGPVTGNWQLNISTTSGSTPFTYLSGSITQELTQPSGSTTVVSILQAGNVGSCFQGLTTLPLIGYRSADIISVTSLPIAGQYLTLSLTSDGSGDALNGSFSISGACAGSVKGNLSGFKVPDLTGNYSGFWNSGSFSPGIMLSTLQNNFSDGLGFFHLSGVATFSGVSCFSTGTIQSISTISGQEVSVLISTNEIGSSTVTLSGSLDQTGNVLSLTTIKVLSGNCASTGGTGVLTR